MKAIGRRSVASVISIVLWVARLGMAVGFFIALVSVFSLTFIKTPNMTITVPVSFRVDNQPAITGRSAFGFELANENTAGRARVDRVDGSLRVPGASRRFIAVNGAILVVLLFVTMLVTDQLRAVLRTLIDGSPFVPDNAVRIRRVGLAVLAGEIVRAAIVYGENAYATAHVAVAGLTFDTWPRLSVTTIGCGLIILVIAEVFRAGTRLDEEQSLTI